VTSISVLQHGLFEDIGEGLVNAKVVLVCVSDEYAASNNCVVEFRFVAKTLKLPVVLAVVGSGHKWRGTEVSELPVFTEAYVYTWCYNSTVWISHLTFIPTLNTSTCM
jgi:hypothetical protein